MNNKKLFSIIVPLVILLVGFHIYTEPSFGAPTVFISTSTTTPTALRDFSFTIGTTTPLTQYGSTTLAVYGSTTIQTWLNTLHAFEVFNAASTSIFVIDTVNSRASTTNFVISNLGNTATRCLNITNQGVIGLSSADCGTASVAGSNLQVQFNDGGAFGGDADFTFNKGDNLLTIANLTSTLSTSTQATSTFAFFNTSTYIGDNLADTLSVVATSTFSSGGVTISGNGLSITSGGLSVTDAATISGGLTLTCTSCITDTNVSDVLTIGATGSVNSTALTDGGTIGFEWVDAEVAAVLTVSGGTVNNSVIGATTPAAGNFTTLSNTGLLNAYGNVTASSTIDFTAATVKQSLYPAFNYSTTTFSGTTSRAFGPAFSAETWNTAKCFTDTGTVTIQINDGTNFMNGFQASTTVGIVTLSVNNAFIAGEKRFINIGNPATAPRQVSCSFDVEVNQ